MLGINSAAQSSKDYSLIIVFFVLLLIVNFVTVMVLLKGKNTRQKLLNGLLMMYEDNNLGKYYDKSIIKNDNSRYIFQIIAIVSTSAAAIIIPIILKIVYKGNV